MNIDIDSILTTVNDSLSRPSFYDQYLKCEVNNTYLVRILPYLKEGPSGTSKSFAFRRQYRWSEVVPGQKKQKWHYVTSASTEGGACPIHDWRNKFMELVEDKDERKRVLGPLSQNVTHVCNVLVVDDPVNPKNNGKVMLLALGKTLWELVESALKGKLDDEFTENFGREMKVGRAILDPSDNGMNLSIKCIPNAMNLPTYEKSAFTLKKASLNLSEEDFEKIKNDMIDPVKSVHDEIKAFDTVKTEFYDTFLSKMDIIKYKNILSSGKKSDEEDTNDYSSYVTDNSTSSHDEKESSSSYASSSSADEEVSQDMSDFIASLGY